MEFFGENKYQHQPSLNSMKACKLGWYISYKVPILPNNELTSPK